MKYFSPSVLDASITTAKLADNAVTLPKMANVSVDTPELVGSAVETAKIGFSAIRQSRIGTATTSQSGSLNSSASAIVSLNTYSFMPDVESNQQFGVWLYRPVDITVPAADADSPQFRVEASSSVQSQAYEVEWRHIST